MAEASVDFKVLGGNARVPAHVVFRSFPHETVVLNLDTGKYHGLNPTAGRMLELLEKSETVDAAAALLAEEYGQDLETIRRDLYELCIDLIERGLLEVIGDDGNTG
jgi:hypothetical protein